MLRQDMTVKLLPDTAREFPSGLTLRQQPYKIISQDSDKEERLWTKHLSQIYDAITQNDHAKELLLSDSEDEEDDYEYEDYDETVPKLPNVATMKDYEDYDYEDYEGLW